MIGLLVLFALLFAPAVASADVPEEARMAYARVLDRHVERGLVDYAGLARDRADLDAYVDAIGRASLPASKEAKIAFYIDAYNALVLRSVLDAHRPDSVLKVEGFFAGRTHRVAGQEVTLDALEKKVLNPLAKDPRTHFVLVCAALGCPPLDDVPYAGRPLESRLARATRTYLASLEGHASRKVRSRCPRSSSGTRRISAGRRAS
ncbi:MAG: DUF547 domain-containing protein [Myxococcales bacterium]|nr:DUF547 domain-containing protein [Myxococcales bacterium]